MLSWNTYRQQLTRGYENCQDQPRYDPRLSVPGRRGTKDHLLGPKIRGVISLAVAVTV
jgi:hypothetical protein